LQESLVAIDIHWIRDNASLAQHCSSWRQLPFVVLDTEFMRTETYFPIAGLIQVGDGKRAFLIDPLQISDWSAFSALLEDQSVLKVLHACSEDLEVFLQLTGSLPTPLFDTQLAAAYLNMGYSMGYSRLVLALLNIDLPKDATRSDWLQRPLTELQVQYAAADVIHLAEVYGLLAARLDQRKLAWLLEDGAEQVLNLRREVVPEELYRDSRLGWKLSRQQLAVLRELYAWRERQALQRNQARNRVIREHSLWPLARTQPDNLGDLAKIEDMHPRTVRQDGETLLHLIKSAGQLPVADWPDPLPEPLPAEATTLLKKLRAIGQAEAERQGMAAELMLRKKHLEEMLRTGYPLGPYRLPESLRGWRRELMGPALLAALAGETQ
jgi:ribonuclease D